MKNTAKPNQDFSPFIGLPITKNYDVMVRALQIMDGQLSEDQRNILVLLVNEKKEITGIKNLGDIRASKIDADELAEAANAIDVKQLFIAYRPILTDKEYEKIRNRKNANSVYYGLEKKTEIKHFCVLAKNLKDKGITLRDICLYDNDSGIRYSNNLTNGIFPG